MKIPEKYIYNKEQIKSILPHRDPFLFVDYITEINENSITGLKLVKCI